MSRVISRKIGSESKKFELFEHADQVAVHQFRKALEDAVYEHLRVQSGAWEPKNVDRISEKSPLSISIISNETFQFGIDRNPAFAKLAVAFVANEYRENGWNVRYNFKILTGFRASPFKKKSQGDIAIW